MEDQYISFEIAKLAKEKGFDEASPWAFQDDGEEYSGFNWWNKKNGWYSRVTQSFLAKWLREKHKITITIIPTIGYNRNVDVTRYSFRLFRKGTSITGNSTPKDTYEEAMEDGLREALRIVG